MTHRYVIGLSLSRRLAGFTLAEMAIVTLLIGIALTLGVGMLKAQMDNAATSTTQKKQETIKNALVAYLRTNWRLPCPDTKFVAGFDGIETPVGGGACTLANFGVLPYATLLLPREMAMDGWGNYMSYSVSGPAWTTTTTFNPNGVGALTVNTHPPVVALTLTSNAVAVIISHGKNGSGAYTLSTGSRNSMPITLDELANTTVAGPYFKREYTDSPAAPGGAFDDIVTFIQADDLLTPLRNDGSLKAESDKLSAIINTIVAQSFATCKVPLAFGPVVGQVYSPTVTITYTLPYAPAISLATTPTNTVLFRLTVGTIPNDIQLGQVSTVYATYGKCS